MATSQCTHRGVDMQSGSQQFRTRITHECECARPGWITRNPSNSELDFVARLSIVLSDHVHEIQTNAASFDIQVVGGMGVNVANPIEFKFDRLGWNAKGSQVAGVLFNLNLQPGQFVSIGIRSISEHRADTHAAAFEQSHSRFEKLASFRDEVTSIYSESG